MGLVSAWVDTAQGQLDGVAASSFGSIIGGAGALISATATLAAVLLGVNMVLQYRPMGAGDVLVRVMRLILIATVGLTWGQFSTITGMVQSGMNAVAAGLLSETSPGTSLASAVDVLISQISDAANAALEPLSWMAGALMSVLVTVGLSVIGAAVALALIFASVMVTVYLSIAPVFVFMLFFEATKDLFSRWLQGFIAYALYPVVIAGVLGGLVRVVRAYLATLSTGDASASISGFIPFLSVLVVMGATIVLIPSVVSGLTGMIGIAGPIAPLRETTRLMRDTSRTMQQAARSLMGRGSSSTSSGGNPPSTGSQPAKVTPLAAKIAARNAKY